MPRPIDALLRIVEEPVPAYTTFGSDSETSTAPSEAAAKKPSDTLTQICPASVVFQTPPPVDPQSPWSRAPTFRPDHAIAHAAPQCGIVSGGLRARENQTCHHSPAESILVHGRSRENRLSSCRLGGVGGAAGNRLRVALVRCNL
jgi:hypothetical protein